MAFLKEGSNSDQNEKYRLILSKGLGFDFTFPTAYHTASKTTQNNNNEDGEYVLHMQRESMSEKEKTQGKDKDETKEGLSLKTSGSHFLLEPAQFRCLLFDYNNDVQHESYVKVKSHTSSNNLLSSSPVKSRDQTISDNKNDILMAIHIVVNSYSI